MISVEQALEKVTSSVGVLEAEERPILDCLGQVLAEDMHAEISVPPYDNAAMDGYALRSQDALGASESSPRYLRVIDTVIAGSLPASEVEPGTAIRIMTGAPIPEGADSVIQFEDTDESQQKGTPAKIGILREVEAGLNIRRAGEDVASGTLVFRQGMVIRPSEIGVLASIGRRTVRVIRRPVVAVLGTGNELVSLDQPLPPGKIYDSNTYSLAALVLRYGGIPRVLGIARDTRDSLVAKLREALSADMLVTSGGVSAGDYDIVKDILADEGEIGFYTVRMKPGKPLAFGTIKGADKAGAMRTLPHLGLPGNPVSSMVTFELFARPAMLKMMGRKSWAKPTIEAILDGNIANKDGRRVFARAVVETRDGRYIARLTGPQGSGILTSMALANGLVIVPEDKAKVSKGDTVQVMMLDWNEEVVLGEAHINTR